MNVTMSCVVYRFPPRVKNMSVEWENSIFNASVRIAFAGESPVNFERKKIKIVNKNYNDFCGST